MCTRQNTPDSQPTTPVPELEPVLPQPVPLVLRGSLLSTVSGTPPALLPDIEETSTEVVKVCPEEKKETEVVNPPVLET